MLGRWVVLTSIPLGLVGTLSMLVVSVGTAAAHVEYVTDSDARVEAVGFFVDVFTDPIHLFLVVVGGITAVALVTYYVVRRPLEHDVRAFRATMGEYTDLVPWLLRLSIGLPLVGAGFAGYFFSPAVPPVIPLVVEPSRLFQLSVGMLLLFGFASRVAALLGLAAYVISVPFFPDLLLANEFVGGFVAIALVGSGRPSADQVVERIVAVEDAVYNRLPPVHLIGRRLERRLEPYHGYAPTIVRLGLGFNFAYLGLTQKLLDPGPALAVVEQYSLTAVVPVSPEMWVVGVGLVELLLGTLLLAGFLTRGVAAVALLVFTLSLFGIPDDPVLAHVSLFGLSSVLLITGSGLLAIDRWRH